MSSCVDKHNKEHNRGQESSEYGAMCGAAPVDLQGDRLSKDVDELDFVQELVPITSLFH